MTEERWRELVADVKRLQHRWLSSRQALEAAPTSEPENVLELHRQLKRARAEFEVACSKLNESRKP